MTPKRKRAPMAEKEPLTQTPAPLRGGVYEQLEDGTLVPSAEELEHRRQADALDAKCRAAGVTDPSSLPPEEG